MHRVHKWWTARVSLSREHESKAGGDRHVAISEGERSTAPVKLNESDIPKANRVGKS